MGGREKTNSSTYSMSTKTSHEIFAATNRTIALPSFHHVPLEIPTQKDSTSGTKRNGKAPSPVLMAVNHP